MPIGINRESTAHQPDQAIDHGKAEMPTGVASFDRFIRGFQMIVEQTALDRHAYYRTVGVEFDRVQIDPHLDLARLADRAGDQTNQDLTKLMRPAAQLVGKLRVDPQG